QMTESAPVAWQDVAGRRVPVAVSFQVRGQTVGFCLSDYDPAYPLTIDPNYHWHTFYGSSGDDNGNAIAVDGGGDVYVAGQSGAAWTGPGGESPLHAYTGGDDITVLKLSSAGVYQWHTFYGTSAIDRGAAIAVDGSGDVYVAGTSYNTAWTGPGGESPLHAYTGGSDIAVLKLSSAGVYQWHTFYGGGSNDYGYGIAVDSSGNVYVTGRSGGGWTGDGGAPPLHTRTGGYDIAVLKLSSAGAYQWHTFYGGGGDERGTDIAVAAGGDVYVAGYSTAAWTGDGGAAPLHAYIGGDDIHVLKLSSAGAYQWHTFYGDSGTDRGSAITVDGSGDVYVAGNSATTWTGDGSAAPLHAYTASVDIAVLKLSSAGVYQWHTFYGDSGADRGSAIAVAGGDVYVAGNSDATWTGPSGEGPLHAYTASVDSAVLKLSSAGAYQWHTFYGDSGADNGNAIAVAGSGGVYVAGSSDAAWTGDGGAAPLHAYTGGNDITVLQLAPSATAVTLASFDAAGHGNAAAAAAPLALGAALALGVVVHTLRALRVAGAAWRVSRRR
ncbi:MAG: SBBP repeat-containing protein, partial [Chloroflexi bacterium]|nr:SBBP repeat-containing protein [Chloroflexota bacterium]